MFLFIGLTVLAVMAFGGLLVACVSFPTLFALPTIRQQLVTLTEKVFSVRLESIINWRFIVIYVVFIEAYGMTLFTTSAMLAESLRVTYWPVPQSLAGRVAAVAAIVFVGAGFVLVLHRTIGVKFRTVGEWVIFLCFITVLAVVAAYVVLGLITILLDSFYF